jgi:hypothetical protein
MRYHHFNRLPFFTLCTITMLSLATYAGLAAGQNVRVAQDAGESATDDPDDTGELTVYPDAQDDEAEVLSPAEQAEALERRAGEQDDNDPSNRAVILGMHVQEGDAGRVKVVDVAAASPAFDGGIREGDEIISFDGLKGKSYREWIDGIRKLVTDTPDGAPVNVELLRDGKRITAELQVPEEKADDARMLAPLGQQFSNEESQSAVLPPGANQPFAPGPISDNDVFINDGGFFGDVDSAGERAMAQIVRLTPQQTTPVNPPNPATQTRQQTAAAAATGARQQTSPVAAGNPATGGAGRIGLAGFRDDANGMVVMVDVGGLAPGSYPVGVEDAGLVMGGGPVRSALNNPIPNDGEVQTQERTNRINRPANNQPANSRPTGNSPAKAPRTLPPPQLRETPGDTGGNRRQSHTQSSIPPTVLAQVTNENSGSGTATPPTGQVQPNPTPPTGEVNPNLTPPTGEVNPNSTPATGEVNPNLTPPTGRVLPPGAPATGRVLPPGAPPTGRVLPSGTTATGQADPDAVGDGVVGSGVNAGIAAGTGQNFSTLAQIGVLTIDQSGTGRLQQVVEGVRVRDVVGQAIVIYAPAAPPQTTVPPNTNVSGTRGDATATNQYPAGNTRAAAQSRLLPGRTPQQVANTGPLSGSPMPVAAGIIRLMSDRRPNGEVSGATGATTRPNQSTQPQSNRQQPASPISPAQRQTQ